ncbi:MAG: molybdate ABC transporter substrate-binding protein [Candidatus Limnocylindria bacterium]
MTSRWGAPLSGVLLLAACSSPLAAQPVELTVYAAASLGNVMERVEAAYETAAPGINLVVATDSSGALRTQIEQGAPADVFLSADTVNPQRLFDDQLVDTSGLTFFAGNTLVVIVPADNPAGIRTPADLAREGMRIVAAGDEVPITGYATQVVDALAELPDYPTDFADAYAANVVSREDNVRAVVAKIQLGEGDAAFVYQTDALASESVRSVALPNEAAYVPVFYAGVVIATSAHPEAARAFLHWLTGPDGRAILAEFGFLPPS